MVSMVQRAALLVAVCATQLGSSSAFTPSKAQAKISNVKNVQQHPQKITTDLAATPDDIFHNYGEESRKYRRTVYTHEDWVRHRSSDRFLRNLKTTFSSGIYKNLFKEVLATTSVATSVVLWNCVFGDYQDFAGVVHPGIMHDSIIPILALPLAPFTLLSPSLGLLLVFRTNSSYKRWDEARKNWGMNINHTRDLVRLGNAYYDRTAVSEERAKEDLERLALTTWAFVRSMKRHLSPVWEDEEDFKKELFEKLPAEQAQNIIDAAHRPNRALQDLSVAIENLPMHFMRRGEVHAAATIFEDNLGSSERLLSSPVPIFYSRWTARFLSFWLLLLPFGLWGPLGISWNHVDLIPATIVMSIFLFGIEELATQLEEPFTILPMQGFCDKIYNWITEIVTFTPGDNGMPVYYYDNYDIDMSAGYVGQVSPEVAAIAAEEAELVSMTTEIEDMVQVSATPAPAEDVTPDAVEDEEPAKKSGNWNIFGRR
jgi:putative membrane protein